MSEEFDTVAQISASIPAHWVETLSHAANVRSAELVVEPSAHISGVDQEQYADAASGLKAALREANSGDYTPPTPVDFAAISSQDTSKGAFRA